MEQVFKEMARISNNISVYLLFKDGNLKARITSRYTENAVMHVAFVMYGDPPITGYARESGFGYDKFSTGIRKILLEIQSLLNERGIKFSPHADLLNNWQEEFRRNGYEVIGYEVIQTI